LRDKLVVGRLITYELIMFLSASSPVAAGIATECVAPILLVCRLAPAIYPILRIGMSVLRYPIASAGHAVTIRGSPVPTRRMFRKSVCMSARNMCRVSSETVPCEAMPGAGVTAHSMCCKPVGDTTVVRGTSYMETAATRMSAASHMETTTCSMSAASHVETTASASGMPTASHMETAASPSGMSAATSAVSTAAATTVRRPRCNIRETECPDGYASEKCERLFGQTGTR
jgi:hypothetical protein